MPMEHIKLRHDGKGNWHLYAPKGHAIGGPFRGSRWAAIDWGTKWISGWKNWSLEIEEERTDEKEDRVSE